MTTTNPSTDATDALYRLDNVVKFYPNGNVLALDHLSLEIQCGEYAVIMGPSGCGKSTLLNLLGSLDRPTEGEIYYRGSPMSALPSLDRYRSTEIGFVFQSFHLLPTLTALENVQVPMFGQPWALKDRVQRAADLLDIVGMSHRLHSLPQRLSIGERQRVALARALANGAKTLLADEPTGNLDSKNGAEVLNIFDQLHQQHGMTLIIITHSDEVARQAERVIHLKDGKLVSEDRAATLVQ